MNAPEATDVTVRFEGAEVNRLIGDRFGAEDGQPVLFLHGGGQTRHAWGGAARHLGKNGYCAIALDQRGHGESARSLGGNYRYDDFAADIVCVTRQIVDETGRTPVLVGASLGGLAGFLAALGTAPLAALVMVDITPFMNPDGIDRIMGFMTADLEEGFASLDDAAAAIAGYLPHRKRPPRHEGLAKNLVMGADGRFRWHWDPAFVNGPRAISSDHYAVCDRMVRQAKAVTCPVHLIRGRDSDLISEADARRFVGLLARGTYTDISGAGHMIAGDRNDAFTEAIVAALEDTGSVTL